MAVEGSARRACPADGRRCRGYDGPARRAAGNAGLITRKAATGRSVPDRPVAFTGSPRRVPDDEATPRGRVRSRPPCGVFERIAEPIAERDSATVDELDSDVEGSRRTTVR